MNFHNTGKNDTYNCTAIIHTQSVLSMVPCIDEY